METAVVEESRANIEAVEAAEVPILAVGSFVVDDDRASKRAECSGIKVERYILLLLGGHSGGQGRFMVKNLG